MSKLTALQKEALLRGINKIPVNLIKKKIDNLELTLDECIEHGLDLSKVEEIQTIKIQQEEIKEKLAEDKEFYDRINNDEIIIQEIQRALNDGRVTEEGLMNNTEINDDLLRRIKSYKKQFHPSENNDVPLVDGTDIFFFGKSKSGKSCVLASIFNYAEVEGLFIDNPVSINGINYKNVIVRELQNGILPDSTEATEDAVTYITTELHKDGEVNPLNFIEMSGEFFSKAAENPDEWDKSIDAHGYLSNSNKKLLFFIVDYQMYSEGEDTSGATQSQDFNLILSQLDNYEKALKNTNCIYIIVNKSDKFPPNVTDKDKFAKEFFMNNFRAVYTNLKAKQDKYNFELRSFDFSVGNFVFNNSYLKEMNYECPRSVLNSIAKQSRRNSKKGWLGSMFSNNDEI
jgi:GTP-binding protein EngB required for normal cell division